MGKNFSSSDAICLYAINYVIVGNSTGQFLFDEEQ